jgi:hypothetical protein
VVPRYLFEYLPAFFIALGALCAFLLSTRYRLAAVALLALYSVVSIEGVTNTVLVPYYQFPDWYTINSVLLSREHKDDLIVLDQGLPYWIVYNYSGFRNHQIACPGLPTDLPWIVRWLSGYPNRRVWYVDNQAWFADPHETIHHYLHVTRPVIDSWQLNRIYAEDIVRVVLFGPRPPGSTKRVVLTTSL